MNLYVVYPSDNEWSCYIISTTRNRAKNEVAKWFDLDYADMRCRTIKKDVGNKEMIIDTPDADGYDIVLASGRKYIEKED